MREQKSWNKQRKKNPKVEWKKKKKDRKWRSVKKAENKRKRKRDGRGCRKQTYGKTCGTKAVQRNEQTNEPNDITKTRVSLKSFSFINRTIQFIYPNGAYGEDWLQLQHKCCEHACDPSATLPERVRDNMLLYNTHYCLLPPAWSRLSVDFGPCSHRRTHAHECSSPFHSCGLALQWRRVSTYSSNTNFA